MGDPLPSPNNQEIGKLFGLGYSSIGRRVTITKSKLSKEDEISKRLEKYKSLIEVRPDPSLLFKITDFSVFCQLICKQNNR